MELQVDTPQKEKVFLEEKKSIVALGKAVVAGDVRFFERTKRAVRYRDARLQCTVNTRTA